MTPAHSLIRAVFTPTSVRVCVWRKQKQRTDGVRDTRYDVIIGKSNKEEAKCVLACVCVCVLWEVESLSTEQQPCWNNLKYLHKRQPYRSRCVVCGQTICSSFWLHQLIVTFSLFEFVAKANGQACTSTSFDFPMKNELAIISRSCRQSLDFSLSPNPSLSLTPSSNSLQFLSFSFRRNRI